MPTNNKGLDTGFTLLCSVFHAAALEKVTFPLEKGSRSCILINNAWYLGNVIFTLEFFRDLIIIVEAVAVAKSLRQVSKVVYPI